MISEEEKEDILRQIIQEHGSVAKCARELGIDPSTLHRNLKNITKQTLWKLDGVGIKIPKRFLPAHELPTEWNEIKLLTGIDVRSVPFALEPQKEDETTEQYRYRLILSSLRHSESNFVKENITTFKAKEKELKTNLIASGEYEITESFISPNILKLNKAVEELRNNQKEIIERMEQRDEELMQIINSLAEENGKLRVEVTALGEMLGGKSKMNG